MDSSAMSVTLGLWCALRVCAPCCYICTCSSASFHSIKLKCTLHVPIRRIEHHLGKSYICTCISASFHSIN